MTDRPVESQPDRPVGPLARTAGLVLGAIVAAAAAIAFSGAAAAPLLTDPGPVVRWGLPVLDALVNLSAATTLGGLVLAAVVLPARSRASVRALVVAGSAAVAWSVLGAAQIVLTYASVAGRPPSGAGFMSELGVFITQVPYGRTLLTGVVLAAAVSVLALLVQGPVGAMCTGLLALVPLVLQASTGHAAGTASHDLAVSALFLHLLGAAIWVGALLVLGLAAGVLGADGPDAVRRFSAIAGWCLAGVAVSGLVSAAIRVGGIDGLGSRYGLLVVAKVVLIGVLGLLGLAHRRRVVAGLERPGARVRALFWRLVAVELVVMGAVSGVATALASTAPPVAQEPGADLTAAQILTGHPLPVEPVWSSWLTEWRWDLLPAAAAIAGAVVYVTWVRRLRARGDAWSRGRTASWLTGLVLLFWVTSGGPAMYGHVLFSAHMIQHMVLAMVIPIFLTLAAPITLAMRALPARKDGSRGPREWLLGLVNSRWAHFFANPIVAGVNFIGSMIAFYYSSALELSMTTYLGHLAMVLHFSLAGYMFVNVLVGVDPGRKRPGHAQRLLLLFATMAFHAFFGVGLVTSDTLLAPDWFGLMGREWGLSAIADQQVGGAITWGIGEIPTLALAIAVAVSWSRDDERVARVRDRRVDRTGDVEMDDYNAMLAGLAHRDAQSAGRTGEEPSSR